MGLLVLLALSLALAIAGCGGTGDAATTTQPAAAGAHGPHGGLSVREALDSDVEGPLLVRGYVIARDGELRLCDGILESSPPQCGDPSLRIETNGVDVSPSEERRSLLGEVDGGAMLLAPDAR